MGSRDTVVLSGDPAKPMDGSHPMPVPSRIPTRGSEANSLTKSDSTASAGGQSFRSHISLPVTGAHPYGTLQVHQPKESPLSKEILMKPLPDDPPPLEAAEDGGEGIGMDGGGDIVLILDLPPAFTVGYDSVSFTTTSHFHGVREIPPGAHFFWATETEASSVRSGFWIVASPKARNIHVMQWDKFNEALVETASRIEARFQRENIATWYPKLTPYQYRAVNANLKDSLSPRSSPTNEPAFTKNTSIWNELTCCVSPVLLKRVTGRQSGDWTVHTIDRVKGAIILPAEMELDRRIQSVVVGTELAFAFFQTAKTFDIDVIGSARTEQAVDATNHILSLTDNPTSGLTDDDVVGELQFAFIVGMHLGNESCVQQWWYMTLRLVFRAYLLTVKKPRIARLLIRTITAQLVYNDKYLDGSILDYGAEHDHSKELRLALIVYKRRLNELLLSLNSRATEEQAAVGRAFSELESWVWRLGWDIRSDYLRSGKMMLEDGEEVQVELGELEDEDERGEFAAVVVELDEQGREKGLVSWN
jgi:A1 cistron-splicing factor AAR2